MFAFAGALLPYDTLHARFPSRFPTGGSIVQYRIHEAVVDVVVKAPPRPAAPAATGMPAVPAAAGMPAAAPSHPPVPVVPVMSADADVAMPHAADVPAVVPAVVPAAPAPLPAAAAPSPIVQAAAAGRRASQRVRAPVLPVLPVLPPPAPPPATTPAARVYTKRKSKASVRRESNTANMNHLELLAWFVNDGGYGLVHLSQLTAAMSHLKATNEKLVDEARAKLTGIKHAIDPGTDAIAVCRCLLVT